MYKDPNKYIQMDKKYDIKVTVRNMSNTHDTTHTPTQLDLRFLCNVNIWNQQSVYNETYDAPASVESLNRI